jgi:hypothetical protein
MWRCEKTQGQMEKPVLTLLTMEWFYNRNLSFGGHRGGEKITLKFCSNNQAHILLQFGKNKL